eukprot:gene21168-biopygen23619
MGFPFPYVLYRKQQPPGKADLAEQFPELSVGPVKTCSFNAALCDALLRGGVPRPRPRRVPLVRRLAPLVRRTQSSPGASWICSGLPPHRTRACESPSTKGENKGTYPGIRFPRRLRRRLPTFYSIERRISYSVHLRSFMRLNCGWNGYPSTLRGLAMQL